MWKWKWGDSTLTRTRHKAVKKKNTVTEEPHLDPVRAQRGTPRRRCEGQLGWGTREWSSFVSKELSAVRAGDLEPQVRRLIWCCQELYLLLCWTLLSLLSPSGWPRWQTWSTVQLQGTRMVLIQTLPQQIFTKTFWLFEHLWTSGLATRGRLWV